MKAFTETVKNFLCLFQLQTCSVVKVYKYIHYMSRKYTSTFLCLDTIARATGFCKRQVQRAIDKLIKLGWLSKLQRKRQSSIFFVPEDIKKLDICDKKLFEREEDENIDFSRECHVNVHPSIKSSFCKEYHERRNDVSSKEEDLKKEAERLIPDCVKVKGLTFEQQLTLAKNFGEVELKKALKFVRKLLTRGENITNLMGLLFSTAKRCKENPYGI